MLYEQNQDNQRLYEICTKSDEVIVDLRKALEYQKNYIKELETSHGLLYNKLYDILKEKNESPIFQ